MRWVESRAPAAVRAAVEVSRAALARQPGNLDLWMLAGRALERMGDAAAAREHWAAAAARFPDTPRPRIAFAQALAHAGDFEGALDRLRALAACRDTASGAVFELRLLIRLDRWDEAQALAPIAERLAPADLTIIQYHARALADEPEALLAKCDRVLAHKPGHANALHHRAKALARLGRDKEARQTLAVDRFLSVGELTLNPDFHAVLRAEILANDTLRPDPRGHTTRKGLQTVEFERQGDCATVELCHAIRRAVEAYAAALEGDHWFVRGRPATARLEAWAVVYSEGGSQAPHRHPAAWLSGVFYVGGAGGAVPAAGGLLVGFDPASRPYAGGPVQRITPMPGRLVMFPSATMHATEPAGPGEARISVAFDVIDEGTWHAVPEVWRALA